MKEPLSLLLVEDDLSLREEITLFLEDFFPTIVVAESSEEAFVYYTQQPFDVVMTDICLPGQDGLHLVERIQKQNPHQRIIVMSAYAEVDYFIRSIELRIYGFLTKPFDSQKLIALMLKLQAELEHKYAKKRASSCIKLFEDVVFDTHTRELLIKDETQTLTQKEEQLLCLLAKHANYFVPNSALNQALWEKEDTSDSTLRALIKRLRDKLSYSQSIVNLKGRGYKLNTFSKED